MAIGIVRNLRPDPRRTERYRELLPAFRELSKAVAPLLEALEPSRREEPVA